MLSIWKSHRQVINEAQNGKNGSDTGDRGTHMPGKNVGMGAKTSGRSQVRHLLLGQIAVFFAPPQKKKKWWQPANMSFDMLNILPATLATQGMLQKKIQQQNHIMQVECGPKEWKL